MKTNYTSNHSYPTFTSPFSDDGSLLPPVDHWGTGGGTVPGSNGNNMSAHQQEGSQQSPHNLAILISLIAVMIILSLLFLYLIVPPLYMTIRRRIPASPRRVEARYLTVEGWLISKRVRAHDDVCTCMGSHPTPPFNNGGDEDPESISMTVVDPEIPSIKASTSYDTAETAELTLEDGDDNDEYYGSCYDCCDDEEDEELECAICICPMRVGDIVSWSSNPACEHFFHHECIKEWLLRHSNCPNCRFVFLPVDEEPNTLSRERHKQLAHERNERLAQTYVCVRKGLVCIHNHNQQLQQHNDDDPKLDGDNNKRMMDTSVHIKQLTCCNVQKDELAKMRGSRVEEGTMSSFRGEEEAVGVMIPSVIEQQSAALQDEENNSNDGPTMEASIPASANATTLSLGDANALETGQAIVFVPDDYAISAGASRQDENITDSSETATRTLVAPRDADPKTSQY